MWFGLLESVKAIACHLALVPPALALALLLVNRLGKCGTFTYLKWWKYSAIAVGYGLMASMMLGPVQRGLIPLGSMEFFALQLAITFTAEFTVLCWFVRNFSARSILAQASALMAVNLALAATTIPMAN